MSAFISVAAHHLLLVLLLRISSGSWEDISKSSVGNRSIDAVGDTREDFPLCVKQVILSN
jgi:hypothetical protein